MTAAEIRQLRDQANDLKRRMTVDRGAGVTQEVLVTRRLVLTACAAAEQGLTREQIEAKLANASSNMFHGGWQQIVVGLLFDDRTDAPSVTARRVR